MAGRFEVSYETHFCSAHALRDYKGTTEPTHGHNFRVIVTVSGSKIDRAGMLVDFLDLKASVDAEIERFNYGFVNEKVPEFVEGKLSPSAENMAYVIFQNVKKKMPRSVKVDSVQLFESPGCAATYRE